jgi:hypothetical protein
MIEILIAIVAVVFIYFLVIKGIKMFYGAFETNKDISQNQAPEQDTITVKGVSHLPERLIAIDI